VAQHAYKPGALLLGYSAYTAAMAQYAYKPGSLHLEYSAYTAAVAQYVYKPGAMSLGHSVYRPNSIFPTCFGMQRQHGLYIQQYIDLASNIYPTKVHNSNILQIDHESKVHTCVHMQQ
jgi:hypothetical protein